MGTKFEGGTLPIRRVKLQAQKDILNADSLEVQWSGNDATLGRAQR